MTKRVLLAAAALGVLFFLGLVLSVDERLQKARHVQALGDGVGFGVLGDSDSHAYHDDVNFGDAPEVRGGALRQHTWQWTEVLAQLRGAQLDIGPWGRWGTAYRRLAVLRDALGQDGRHPRKEDHLHNLAFSGAVCEQLNSPPRDQVGHLLWTMAQSPERWRHGVVVIRMGVNDFGGEASLDALSRDPLAPGPVALMNACVGQLQQAVSRLHAVHPGLNVVLVGIFNNAEWTKFHHLWQSPQALANIRQGLARFDDGLRAMAKDQARLAFFDDQAWFEQRWGTRSATGQPAYRRVHFGPRFEVSNTLGDEPMHATLRDGHAGTVWNALWAQSLVALLNQRFGLAIPPLTTDELVQFVDPDGRFGMR